jgi:hypothetical protein
MIHLLEWKAVKVDEIAWNMDRGELPLAIRYHAIARREAADQQRASRRPITLAHDVAAGVELFKGGDSIKQGVSFGGREIVSLLYAAKKWIKPDLDALFHVLLSSSHKALCHGLPLSKSRHIAPFSSSP